MSEQQTVETTETTEVTEQTTEEQTQNTDNGDVLPESIKAILEKERKAARDAERRAKAAERKAQEYEDANKSAEEQAIAKAERADARAADAEKRLVRMQVALEKSIPADLMEFLAGDTREEIEAKADALMAHLKPRAATDFDSGARETVDEKKTPEQQHQELLTALLTGGRARP